MKKFSRCGGRFNPCFRQAEEVRVVTINQIGYNGRMEGVKNRADVECAESETVRTWIQFDVAGKEKKGKNRRTQEVPVSKSACAGQQVSFPKLWICRLSTRFVVSR